MRIPPVAKSVFLNCPFDAEYQPLFEALVFCVVSCGFSPRCALEAPDAGSSRLGRLGKLVSQSAFSIHDLSRVELSNGLPRFNMPFVLGLALGARRFGAGALQAKRCLILYSDRYRYQRFLSDIAGQDIRAHANSIDLLIATVRDWLRGASGRHTIPGPKLVARRFASFAGELHSLCEETQIERTRIEFADYTAMIETWLTSSASAPPHLASP